MGGLTGFGLVFIPLPLVITLFIYDKNVKFKHKHLNVNQLKLIHFLGYVKVAPLGMCQRLREIEYGSYKKFLEFK